MIGISVPVLIALLCVYEYRGGNGMECKFYRYTGFFCPGCGSGRAVRALIHGHFAEAAGYNILLPILGIPCLLILAHEYLRIVFPRLNLKPVSIPQPAAVGAAALIVIFWIMRNIPAFAFLAP